MLAGAYRPGAPCCPEPTRAIKGYGEGRFDIDYDKAARLPHQDSKRGRVSFQVPGGEGSFEFAADANIHWFDPAKVALERWSIKSRWTATGAGRADVRATGGDLASPVTMNECWDAAVRSTFLAGNTPSQEKWGVESTD